MKAQLILLDTPIIVSDEISGFTYNKPTWNISGKIGFPENNQSRKIIAGLPNLPSIDFNSLEEKFGIVEWANYWEKVNIELQHQGGVNPHAYRLGFKSAQSLNKKMFSLEDMRNFCEYYTKGITNSIWDSMEDYIQSLSQPKVFDIEIEMERKTLYTDDGLDYKGDLKPKITNNQIKIIKVL